MLWDKQIFKIQEIYSTYVRSKKLELFLHYHISYMYMFQSFLNDEVLWSIFFCKASGRESKDSHVCAQDVVQTDIDTGILMPF